MPYVIKEIREILELIAKQKIVCDLSVVLRLKDLEKYLENDGD